MSNIKIEDVDLFLEADKFLDGLLPEWGDGFAGEIRSNWNLVDSLGVTMQAHLSVSLKESLDRPSISCIYRQHPVFRLDVVSEATEKPSPPDAARYNLPNYVNEIHAHTWEHNREYVNQNWNKHLPYRMPISDKISELEHALVWVTHKLNITISNEQRVVFLPNQGRFLT